MQSELSHCKMHPCQSVLLLECRQGQRVVETCLVKPLSQVLAKHLHASV